jgi:hypothetical protein
VRNGRQSLEALRFAAASGDVRAAQHLGLAATLTLPDAQHSRTNGFHAPKDWQRAKALMPSFRLGDRVPDLGAAVGTLIDEVDLRQAPMGLDVSHIHRQQSYAAWTDNRSGLDFVMLDVGWHVGSPCKAEQRKIQPRTNLTPIADTHHQLLRT